MQRVYSHQNPAMVYHAKNLLENRGIEAIIKGEHLAAATGGIAPTDAWVELWVVEEGQVEEALRIVEDALDESEVAEAPPWTCPNCGEEVEGQFAVCWKCGQERPA